jgi:hypothetical protein
MTVLAVNAICALRHSESRLLCFVVVFVSTNYVFSWLRWP